MNCITRKNRSLKIESADDGDRTNYFVYFEGVLLMRQLFAHQSSQTSIFPLILDEADRLLDQLGIPAQAKNEDYCGGCL